MQINGHLNTLESTREDLLYVSITTERKALQNKLQAAAAATDMAFSILKNRIS